MVGFESARRYARTAEGEAIALLHVTGCPLAPTQAHLTPLQRVFLLEAVPRTYMALHHGVDLDAMPADPPPADAPMPAGRPPLADSGIDPSLRARVAERRRAD